MSTALFRRDFCARLIRNHGSVSFCRNGCLERWQPRCHVWRGFVFAQPRIHSLKAFFPDNDANKRQCATFDDLSGQWLWFNTSAIPARRFMFNWIDHSTHKLFFYGGVSQPNIYSEMWTATLNPATGVVGTFQRLAPGGSTPGNRAWGWSWQDSIGNFYLV